MEQALFSKFRTIAYEKAGIALNQGKQSLVSARVAKRQRALGIETPRQYLKFLEDDNSGTEIVYFLDAISTNFTSFMREPDHFKVLSDEANTWIVKGRNRVRLWCAASSSGEEPYSIAITVLEALKDKKLDFKILATDISTRVLDAAEAGIYEQTRIEPLTKAQRTKYLERRSPRSSEEQLFEVKPAVKRHIVFKRLNLSKPPFPMNGPLDLVMCRNVMIYFDNAVRQGLVSEMERLLCPGGLLLTGHSETLTGIQSGLKFERPSVYRKPLH